MAPATFRRHRERGGESPPSSSSSLTFPPRWEKGFPSGPWLPWRRRDGSPFEIGSLSLFPSVSAFLILPFHRFLNSRRSVTPIGLKFGHDFYPDIGFLAAKEGHQPPYGVATRAQGALPPGARPSSSWAPRASSRVDSTSQNSHIFQKNLRKFLSRLDSV